MKHYLKGAIAAILTVSGLVWAQMVFDPSQIPTITNDMMASVTSQTIKGRVTGGTGDPEDLTAAQVRTLINVADGAAADQTITLTGDITGSGTGSFVTAIGSNKVDANELVSTSVVAGSYTLTDITVDADGRITAASNGTGGGGGNVSATGSPLVTEYARWTNGTTIEGRTKAEQQADLDIESGTDFDPVGTDNSDDNAVNTTYANDYRAANFVSGTDYEPAKGVDDNFVTDTEKIVVGNTSGTNTGDKPSYIDSSDAGAVYGTLTGLINGSNTAYTVAQADYTAGLLKVWFQGQLQSGVEITETTPASGIFTLSFAPPTGTTVMVEYQ